jgi:hypothetical protein
MQLLSPPGEGLVLLWWGYKAPFHFTLNVLLNIYLILPQLTFEEHDDTAKRMDILYSVIGCKPGRAFIACCIREIFQVNNYRYNCLLTAEVTKCCPIKDSCWLLMSDSKRNIGDTNQIKVYLSRALNTTGVVDLTVKCLLTGSNQ